MATAEERRVQCEGCGRRVVIAELTTVSLPEETLACCETCADHVTAVATAHGSTRECDGCGADITNSDPAEIDLPDGTTVTCCSHCATSWDDTAEEPETTEIATQRSLCSQCHEWHDGELFHVTTIDGRSEKLCPACRQDAEERGVIKDVAMRTQEAREILGLEEGADETAIREAFHQQIQRAHPDRSTGSQSAFKLVKEAYDRLS